MAKTDFTGIAILGGVAILGFGLLKSDFFKGIGAVGGAVGDVADDVGQVTSNIADFTNPLGAYGTQVALNIDAIGERTERNIRREGEQSDYLDRGIFEITKGPTITERGGAEIFKQEQKSLRIKDRQETSTAIQENVLDYAEGISNIPKYNPAFVLANWIKSKVSAPKITGSVISDGKTKTLKTTPSELGKSFFKKSSVSKPYFPTSQKSSSLKTLTPTQNFMDKAGYQGTSTREGIVWVKKPTKWF